MAEGKARPSALASFLTDQIVTPGIKRSFQVHLDALEAVKQKEFQHNGEVVKGERKVDHEVRLQAAMNLFKLGDYVPHALDVTVGGEGLTVILQGLDGDKV